METRLFDVDPERGITKLFHYDHTNDTFTIETQQRVDDLIATNKAELNAAPEAWRGDMHKVASIPIAVYHDLKQKGIIDDPKKLRAWLNDPDNRYFRTKPGRV